MEKTDAAFHKYALFEAAEFFDRSFQVAAVVVFNVGIDARINKIRLTARAQSLANEFHRRIAIVRLHPACDDFTATGRAVTNDRDVQIAEGRHGQRSRDGRGGHHKTVRITALAKRRSLVNAEIVRFVDENQSEVGKIDVGLQQGDRANDDIHLSIADAVSQFQTFFAGDAAGDQLTADATALEESLHAVIMLPREDFGRSHDCYLQLSGDCGQGGIEGYNSFARADIALQEPVHRNVLGKVGTDFGDDLALVFGEQKRKAFANAAVDGVVYGDDGSGCGVAQMVSFKSQAGLHQEQFIVFETAFGGGKLFVVGGIVDYSKGLGARNEQIFLEEVRGKEFRH